MRQQIVMDLKDKTKKGLQRKRKDWTDIL